EAILSEMEEYRDLVRENIDYPGLIRDMPLECDRIDEIVEIVVETLCSTKDTIRVAGNDFPADVVRSRLLKLNSDHIGFVIGCMKENTTKIRNIKQYLLTTLYNAPITIDSYYSALVNHDLAQEQEKSKRNGIPDYTCEPWESL
ncbi:MAG: helix-turn-helix domain-containing protein, partial [Oscillospiraceae bacterium]|nr:helix-turn-helix domain-containing protein [Oscillospiraceae bacterium]